MRVVLGLGSNLGDRLGYLKQAVSRIRDAACFHAVSPIYETDPVGGPPQGAYLNAAVLVEWSDALDGLLAMTRGIENDLGRARNVHWGPRTLDIDLLWAEGVWADDDQLTVPHPRLYERSFALQPLLDVAPDAIDPKTLRPLESYLRRPRLIASEAFNL